MFEKLLKNKEVEGDASTYESSLKLVPVKSIIGNNLILKTDGTYCVILKVHAVNFDLKSEREKLGIIYTFGELLNSLTIDVPLQVLIHSKRLDTEKYIRLYEERLYDPNCSPQIKEFINDHLQYFQETVMRHNLLQREFFIVIPYNPNKTERRSAGDGIADGAIFEGIVKNMLKREAAEEDSGNKKKGPKNMMEADNAFKNLGMRAGQIQSQLARLGVHSEILRERDIISLFYELFNPGMAETQKIREIDTSHVQMVSGPEELRRLPRPNNQ